MVNMVTIISYAISANITDILIELEIIFCLLFLTVNVISNDYTHSGSINTLYFINII
jgi:hypothetical protein